MAAPILEQTYRYAFPSAVEGDGADRRLRLATSGGPAPNPEFFRGRLLLPVVASDLLLTVGDVARARFHVPPAMLVRILRMADPVATCADNRLRFEAFSACCSVHGRVDVLPDGFDGEVVGRGTTNVDMGTDLQAALAGAQDRSELGLAAGASSLGVVADATSVVERRVPLPSRWVQARADVAADSDRHTGMVAEAIAPSLGAVGERPAGSLVPLLRLLDELLAATGSRVVEDARPDLETPGFLGGQAGRLARSILARGGTEVG